MSIQLLVYTYNVHCVRWSVRLIINFHDNKLCYVIIYSWYIYCITGLVVKCVDRLLCCICYVYIDVLCAMHAVIISQQLFFDCPN